MASERTNMESASVDWSYAASHAFLPPRTPLFSGAGQSSNHESRNVSSNWSKFPQPPANRRHHQRTPSSSFLPRTPAWVDDLLNDTPDVPPARNNHRRSSSDSIAFLDTPLEHVHIPDNTEGESSDVGSMDPKFSRRSKVLEKLYEEPIITRDAEGMSMQKHQNGNGRSNEGSCHVERRVLTGISLSPSDQDNAIAISLDYKKACTLGQSRNDRDVQSAVKSEPAILNGGKGELSNPGDGTVDPKRAKRILANRQSAQRSRVRKLQYISELERTVTVLQEEVSALSPQVTYLDRHRIFLNFDNSAMKQRIAALAQEKLFKDAHNEALKNELHRLRQLYQLQQQKHGHQSFVCQLTSQQFDAPLSPLVESIDNDGVSDVSSQFLEQVYKDNEADLLKSHGLRSPAIKPIVSSHSSNAGDKGKDSHIHSLQGLSQINAEFKHTGP